MVDKFKLTIIEGALLQKDNSLTIPEISLFVSDIIFKSELSYEQKCFYADIIRKYISSIVVDGVTPELTNIFKFVSAYNDITPYKGILHESTNKRIH